MLFTGNYFILHSVQLHGTVQNIKHCTALHCNAENTALGHLPVGKEIWKRSFESHI
jgi:hypothetical protein